MVGCSGETVWLSSYLPLAWAGHCCLGLAMGVLGPTQPFLATQVGVPNKQINFIWTGRALGTCIAAVITSFVFRLYIKKSWQKLTFLAFGLMGIGFFILLIPWITSFWLLLSSLLLVGFSLGCFDSADNSLFVYMLGPDRSGPFIQSLHAAVALGFTLGSLLVHPFLPPATQSNTICQDLGLHPSSHHLLNMSINLTSEEENTITVISEDVDIHLSHPWLHNIPDLAWPFIIIALGNLITATAFLVLALLGLPMPQFYDMVSTSEEAPKNEQKGGNLRHPNLILVLSFFYFTFSCGLEAFFQSQSFTFALCGPHLFPPSQAATLTTIYFSSFLTGRFSGILLSNFVSTTTIILCSQVGCVLSSLFLAFCAGWLREALYLGTAAMGFSVSTMFASGYSWLAEQVDLTGSRGGVVFLGANFGWLIFPPIAGAVIFAGPWSVGLFHLSLGLTLANVALFVIMTKISKMKS